ncbi:MAG: hypothetical protein ACOYEQ_08195 [Bacillota bacterium]|jgi:hypothetical protein
MSISTDPAMWLMAFIVLSLISFVFKDNPAFRIAENIYVGAGAGHMIAAAYKNVTGLGLYPLLEQGKFSRLIPIILGLTLFARYSKKYAYVGRYAIALPLGMGTGIALRGIVSAQILSQVRATLLPLDNFNNLVIIVGVTATICFFLFTTTQNKMVKTYSAVGKYFILVSLGLTFATAVFTEVSLYLGSISLLLDNWLGLIK